MTLEEAIDQLKHLPPDRQKRVIQLIADEEKQAKTGGEPLGWVDFAIMGAKVLERDNFSEDPTAFAGRDFE